MRSRVLEGKPGDLVDWDYKSGRICRVGPLYKDKRIYTKRLDDCTEINIIVQFGKTMYKT